MSYASYTQTAEVQGSNPGKEKENLYINANPSNFKSLDTYIDRVRIKSRSD